MNTHAEEPKSPNKTADLLLPECLYYRTIGTTLTKTTSLRIEVSLTDASIIQNNTVRTVLPYKTGNCFPQARNFHTIPPPYRHNSESSVFARSLDEFFCALQNQTPRFFPFNKRQAAVRSLAAAAQFLHMFGIRRNVDIEIVRFLV